MVSHDRRGSSVFLLSTVAYAEAKGGEDLTDFSDYILPQFTKLPETCRWDVMHKQVNTHACAAQQLSA